MGTPDPRIPPLPPPETPKGVQPGGEGVFVRMELAWGRLRRAYLRRFRPAHVARWQARHFDGETPAPRNVVVSLQADTLIVSGDAMEARWWPLDSVVIVNGSSPRGCGNA